MLRGDCGGGGLEQKSRSRRTRRSSPPSIVRISRIRGDVDVKYVRCVSELKSGSGEVVSSATQSNRTGSAGGYKDDDDGERFWQQKK